MFIRAVLKGQKKKIKGSDKPSFDFLMKELVRCFGESVKKAEIGYYDEDKEFIRLTNDEEWEICIEETHIKNKGKDVYTVEVHVIPADNATEVSVSEISDATKSFIAAPMIDTTKSDIQDWKVIDKTDEEQKVFSEPILHESMSMPTEPSIFEDPVMEEKPAETSQIQSFTNYSQNDILVDIKVTGTPEELERIQRTVIHQFAPHAGFEVDKCEVLVKRECPEEMSDNDSILDNGSQISHMTNELKDEIETLIEEKLKRLSLYREEPKMTKKSAPERISCGNYDHGCVTCDNCRQRITGCARFKSIFRRDFDLCETCEATGIHPEPLIKIRNPIGPKIGLRLNAEFETIKSLFTLEEPKKVQVFQSLPLCHIRKTNEEKMEKIAKAEQCLKSSILSSKIETPTKMDVEKTVKAPSLCHIRATPKIEEKPAMKEEPISAPVKVEPTETPKKVDSGMLSILSRMFPHHDTKVIAEFLSKNEGLTLEDIVNKFMDTKL